MGRQNEIPDPDIFEAISAVKGDKRTALEAIRNRLAAELARSKGQAAAAVAKELRATINELEALPGAEVDPVDELAVKRADRRTGATG